LNPVLIGLAGNTDTLIEKLLFLRSCDCDFQLLKTQNGQNGDAKHFALQLATIKPLTIISSFFTFLFFRRSGFSSMEPIAVNSFSTGRVHFSSMETLMFIKYNNGI